MPKSVNKVILVGNVGKDPEVRYSHSGAPVANFNLATNEKFKDRNNEWQDRTEWHSIVAWQRLAEIGMDVVYENAALVKKAEHLIKAYVGVTANVRVLEPGTIERSQGKAKRVIDRRPKA